MLHSHSSACAVFGDLNDCLLVLMDLAHGKAPGIYNSDGERKKKKKREWSEREEKEEHHVGELQD